MQEEEARILVIDDEEAARYGICRALAQPGYVVEEASDARTALTVMETRRPDVVISDINMPGMDGLALLREVNSWATPPLVILITAYGSEEVVTEALRAGAYNYLSKPFEVEELRIIVRNAVEKQRLLQENRRYTEELKRTLEELRQSQMALVRAEKMASLARLVAGIVHEINTPLGVLRSGSDTTQLAASKIAALFKNNVPAPGDVARLTAALNSAAEQSRVACDRMSSIVANLKELAHLDRPVFQRIPVTEGIESALRLIRHELDDGIEVRKRYEEGAAIECAPGELNQLFMNLFLRSCAAIRRRGGGGSIWVSVRNEGPAVRTEIEDDGEGIPAEDLAGVFDPAFKTEKTRIGIDLGLPICYQIVKSHQGRIEVESRPPGGTRFVVTLPVSQRAETPTGG